MSDLPDHYLAGLAPQIEAIPVGGGERLRVQFLAALCEAAEAAGMLYVAALAAPYDDDLITPLDQKFCQAALRAVQSLAHMRVARDCGGDA